MKRTFLILATLGPLLVLGCGLKKPSENPGPAASAPAQPLASPTRPVDELKEPKTKDLFQASSLGNVNDVKVFLRRDPEAIRRPNGIGLFPIHLAADQGRSEVIPVLLAAGADVNTPHPMVQATPLQYAATGGHLDAVRTLLDAGARVDAVDSVGRTPLMWAAWKGKEDVVQELLKRGANAKATTETGWTALRYAEQGGHTQIVELLKNHR